MNSKTIEYACKIVTGKLDANQAVKNGKYPFFTCAEYPDTIDNFAFDNDVVLIAGNNANGNFHVSRFTGKFNAYQRTYVLTAQDGIDINYIYYALKLELKRLKEKSQGSQTKFLTMPILANIRLQHFDKAEQLNISQILTSIDKKIDINNRINAELEAMAKTLYDYWFVQFDFPNEHGKPYKSSGGKMVYSAELKREIPVGWDVKQLIDIFDVCYGHPFASELFTKNTKQHPVVRIRDILGCSISAYTSEKAPDKFLLKEQDLLIGMDGNFHMNFWAGKTAFLNQRCVRIRKKSDYSVLHAYFSSSPYIQAREKNVSRTTVGHLSAKDIKALCLLAKVERINILATIFFDTVLAKMCKTQIENQQLTQLRDWLLPMLMNGQVTIK